LVHPKVNNLNGIISNTAQQEVSICKQQVKGLASELAKKLNMNRNAMSLQPHIRLTWLIYTTLRRWQNVL